MVSLVETTLNPVASDDQQLLALTAQVLHNLQFQHRWTNVKLHQTSISGNPFPRPLLSGLPPKRIYLNPDEQADILRREIQNESQVLSPELSPEVEWVLPMHITEEWSLKSLAKLFELIEHVPGQTSTTKWRPTKRILMAILHNDSTIVYYFSHDGIVKPRQN